jgi:hypothetical protein
MIFRLKYLFSLCCAEVKVPEIAFNCLFKHSRNQLKILKNNSVNSIVPVLFTITNKPQRAVPRNHELELPPSYILSIQNPPSINTSPSQWPKSQQIWVARLAVPLNLRPNRCKQYPSGFPPKAFTVIKIQLPPLQSGVYTPKCARVSISP